MTTRLTFDRWHLQLDDLQHPGGTRLYRDEGRWEVDDFAIGQWLHVEQLDEHLWHVRVGNLAGDVYVDRDGWELHNWNDLGDM